jgi:U3 small nucleolar RNA-associated protein 3
MFKRERIMFNPQDESDEDINADQGEDVLGLNLPGNDSYVEEDEDDDYSEEEVALKKRKSKMKPDLTAKGRFGRPVPTSDDEASSSGSEDEDEERWGRSYYSRPSNRREKETGEFDETREEEREMEEKEVRRLQRKARENMGGAEDWGLDEGQLQEPA